MPCKLTWHGHANFQISSPEVTILIDPFFEGNPKSDLGSDAIEKADLVLVTHDHGDHVGQTIDISRRTGAMVLAVVDTMSGLVERGLPKDNVFNGIGTNIGGTVEFKGFQITMVQAFHSSETGVAAGYVVRTPDGYCLYHAGDTGIFASMELFGKLWDIDLALLPIGGVFTMDARQAAMACRLLGCGRVTPMHWGTFPVLEQNVQAFAKELERHSPDTGLFIMTPGKSISLEKKPRPKGCPCE